MQNALKGVSFILIEETLDKAKENLLPAYHISAFPSFIKVDAAGKKLKAIDGGAWDENIPRNMAPVMKDFLK